MRDSLKEFVARVVLWLKNQQDHDRYYEGVVDWVDLDNRLRQRGLGGL